MTEATESAPPATEPLPSVGERLMQARLSQGLSLGEMARQLKLSVKQVEALERDDYRSFPGALWVRGFLRNYAKVLGLDADALVAKAGLTPQVAQGEAGAIVASNTPASAGRERRRLVVLILAFVILGLLVLGLLGKRAGRHAELPEGTLPPAATAPATDPMPAATTPVPLTIAPASPEAQTLDPSSGLQTGPSSGEAPGAAGAPAPAAGPAEPANPSPSTAPAAGAVALPAGSPAQPAQGTVPSPSPISSPPPASSAPQPPAAPGPAAAPEAAKPLSGAAVAPQVKTVVPAGSAPAQAPQSAVQTDVAKPQPGTPARPQAGPGASPVPASSTPATPSVASASPVPATPASGAATADSAAPAAETPPEEVKPRTLRMTFTQSVDVRIVDANGKVLIGSLQAAGTERSVRGLPPFVISVGNVHAVKLVYRGREVDMTSRGRTGPAKLTLK